MINLNKQALEQESRRHWILDSLINAAIAADAEEWPELCFEICDTLENFADGSDFIKSMAKNIRLRAKRRKH